MRTDDEARSGKDVFDFEAMVHEVPALVWTANPDGALDFVCTKTCAFFGRTFEQMIEWGWAAVVHPDDLPLVGEHWSRSLETGEPYDLSFRLRQASDGSFRRFIVRALPKRGPDGTITKWYGVAMDVEDLSRHAG